MNYPTDQLQMVQHLTQQPHFMDHYNNMQTIQGMNPLQTHNFAFGLAQQGAEPPGTAHLQQMMDWYKQHKIPSPESGPIQPGVPTQPPALLSPAPPQQPMGPLPAPLPSPAPPLHIGPVPFPSPVPLPSPANPQGPSAFLPPVLYRPPVQRPKGLGFQVNSPAHQTPETFGLAPARNTP